ncbi:unnamed protein product [Phaeothamnion confervicola]
MKWRARLRCRYALQRHCCNSDPATCLLLPLLIFSLFTGVLLFHSHPMMEANPYGIPQGMVTAQGMRQGQGMQAGMQYQVAAAGPGAMMQQANMAGVPQQGMLSHVGGGMGGAMGMGAQGIMPMGIVGRGADSIEDLLGLFPCVRLRGLPFEATVDDVLRFFQGLVVLDCVMVVRGDGRGVGEALVLFTNQMEMNMALSRDKQHMGRRYIEIFQAKRQDYYHAVATYVQVQMMHPGDMRGGGGGSGPGGGGGFRNGPMGGLPMQGGMGGGGGAVVAMPMGDHTGVLRLRGLPFSATKDDIVNFFQGFSVVPEAVTFVVRSDGRVTGEAFVTMPTIQDAEAAMALNGNHIGSRYVEIFPSTPEELHRQTSRHG